jgi:hypothetical protein
MVIGLILPVGSLRALKVSNLPIPSRRKIDSPMLLLPELREHINSTLSCCGITGACLLVGHGQKILTLLVSTILLSHIVHTGVQTSHKCNASPVVGLRLRWPSIVLAIARKAWAVMTSLA